MRPRYGKLCLVRHESPRERKFFSKQILAVELFWTVGKKNQSGDFYIGRTFHRATAIHTALRNSMMGDSQKLHECALAAPEACARMKTRCFIPRQIA
jgi:hypothetical protein